MESNTSTQQHDFNYGWYFFIACVLAGVGIGLLTDNSRAGSIIGTAIGFMVVGMTTWARQRKNSNS